MRPSMKGTATVPSTARGRRFGPARRPRAEPDEDNVWVTEATTEDWEEDGELDAGLETDTALELSQGEWEPTTTRVRRKIVSLYKRIF